MNQFLRGHKVLEVGQEIIQNERGASWCFCVRYIEGSLSTDTPSINGKSKSGTKEKVDYREILDEATFATFSKLRKCRKQIAEAEAIPAYAVFLDAELAEMATLVFVNMETIATVNGIGAAKLQKYGTRLIESYEQIDKHEA